MYRKVPCNYRRKKVAGTGKKKVEGKNEKMKEK
jgi:hypothetical protein